MKTRYFLSSIILALGLLVGPGCTTLTPPQQQTLDEAAVVLRSAARGAGVLAISENPANAAKVRAAVTTLDALILSGNYDSAAVLTAFDPLMKQIQKPEIRLAVGTTLDLYQLLIGRYVVGQVNSNPVAKALLTALRDGGQQALPPQ